MLKYILLLFAGATFFSCDFKKEIDFDLGKFEPSLVVNASLNSIDSTFRITIVHTNPSVGVTQDSVLTNAQVRLYEEDKLIVYIPRADTVFLVGNGFEVYQIEYLPRKNIVVNSGKTYRLEVSAPGFKDVHSTLKAPTDLQVESVSIDTTTLIRRNSNKTINLSYYSRTGGWYGLYDPELVDMYYPIKVKITGNSSMKSYIMLELERLPNLGTYPYSLTYNPNLVITDRTLLLDNPEAEIEGLLSNGEYNTFIYQKFVSSDISFANKTTILNFLVSAMALDLRSYDRLIRQGHEESDIKKERAALIFHAGHISKETFLYYRSYILQSDGLDFFSEPSQIYSNINNGYGYFSIVKTNTLTVLEYDTYTIDRWHGK